MIAEAVFEIWIDFSTPKIALLDQCFWLCKTKVPFQLLRFLLKLFFFIAIDIARNNSWIHGERLSETLGKFWELIEPEIFLLAKINHPMVSADNEYNIF